MSDAADFTKLVPGFEFLQNLVKNAGSTLPSVGQWVAPTLDADEIDKRIGELRTVQFWLEQNARMLATTIQALEVQRMTLSTLKNMNVQMGDLRDALTIRLPQAAPAPAEAAPRPAARKSARARSAAPAAAPAAEAGAAPSGAVDPMQWWGALTRQFTEIATKALQDGGAAAAAVAPAMGAGAPGPSVPAPAPSAVSRAARGAKSPSAAARRRRPSRDG